MIRSMTGYGRGECARYNRKFVVEIKSVNHRYYDINIRLPRNLNVFEENVRKILSAEIFRGKTDVFISFETFSKEDIKLTLNEELADAYVEQLAAIQQRYHLQDSNEKLRLIASFSDVISIEKNFEDENIHREIWEALSEALNTSLKNFISMRENEGASLKMDILRKIDAIMSLTDKVANKAPLVFEEYKAKLLARMSESLANVEIDEARILTECAVYADKACIDEELIRLKSHIKQLREILEETDSIGRKLDFLVQEMNREVNTIGSKSNDIEVTKLSVELKSEIEKIREQLQNIE